MKHTFAHAILTTAILTALSTSAMANTSLEDRLKAMETRQNALESENLELKGRLKTTEQKINATSEPSGKSSWADSTRVGGYGELHYRNLDDQHGSSDKNEMDLHRFVLFFGHDFSPATRFFSELEVEHDLASKSGPGEVELEQAFIEHDLNDMLTVRGGVFLTPAGILNETHEPPAFYGVERNPVETNIIPSTWWEGGAGVTARLGNGFTLDGTVSSGLKTASGDKYAVRKGRQKAAEAVAKDLAYTARLKWTDIPGLEIAGTLQYQSDITQSLDASAGAAWLSETHAVLNRGPFTLKALYAQWNLDGSGPKAAGADKQSGWYIEPSYKFSEQFGIFGRYNRWDNQAGDSADSKFSQVDVGVNYWPHPDVVVKLDYQNQSAPSGSTELDGFNIGIGYQF